MTCYAIGPSGAGKCVGGGGILPDSAAAAYTVGVIGSVGRDAIAGAAIRPSGARTFVSIRRKCLRSAGRAYTVGGIGPI